MPRYPFVILLLLAACRAGVPARPAEPGSGLLSVEWKRGSGRPNDSVTVSRFSGPAVARWCAGDTLLEVLAIRNDTAVGFTLLPPDSLVATQYSLHPSVVPVPWRPQAAVALRYVVQFGTLGFETVGGMITVTEVGRGGL